MRTSSPLRSFPGPAILPVLAALLAPAAARAEQRLEPGQTAALYVILAAASVVLAVLYFSPSILARRWKHPQLRRVFLLNIFLGPIALGWALWTMPGQASAADSPQLAALLSRYPGPVTLYPSRAKWLASLAGFALLAAALAWGGWTGSSGTWESWGVVGVLVLLAAFSGLMLLPGAAELTLDANGFDVANYFSRHRTSWTSASAFELRGSRLLGAQLVYYDDAATKDQPLAELGRAMTGRDAALPDSYGLSAADLARLMTRWRELALGMTPHEQAAGPQAADAERPDAA